MISGTGEIDTDMTDKFLKIVITKPELIHDEAAKITKLLENGVDYVHLRKPGASLRDVRNIIEDIPYKFRRRLKLHGHFELLNDFNLGGVHLNSRCPAAPETADKISRSCHTTEELSECEKFEYVTLSPIYDSISKTGYHAAFDLASIKEKITGKNVIALGGVTPFKFEELKRSGFAGGAMLGIVWDDFDKFLSLLQ